MKAATATAKAVNAKPVATNRSRNWNWMKESVLYEGQRDWM